MKWFGHNEDNATTGPKLNEVGPGTYWGVSPFSHPQNDCLLQTECKDNEIGMIQILLRARTLEKRPELNEVEQVLIGACRRSHTHKTIAWSKLNVRPIKHR